MPDFSLTCNAVECGVKMNTFQVLFFESDACDGLEEMGYFSHFSKGISLLCLLQCVAVVGGYAL
ncbi:hypothetical protein Barb6_02600 [Bacteroidales bacterium Barb6]|nr:hypothetical protein Barb6_02600 [Bacteroidales bacterium Barb6]